MGDSPIQLGVGSGRTCNRRISESKRFARTRAATAAPFDGDLRAFLTVADALDLDRLGRADDRFLSYGNYPLEGQRLFAAGVWDAGLQALDTAGIVEDLAYSWMSGDDARHPSRGETQPAPDKAAAYYQQGLKLSLNYPS